MHVPYNGLLLISLISVRIGMRRLNDGIQALQCIPINLITPSLLSARCAVRSYRRRRFPQGTELR
jgi:hypothetical protein